MLFGSFFSAYFFARVAVPHEEWPPHPYELPVYLAFLNTIILVSSSFTMHWALQSIKRNNRAGLIAGLAITFGLGLTFLLIQAREYTRIGFSPHDLAFGTTFFGLTGLHGCHVFLGLTLARRSRSCARYAATTGLRPTITWASRSQGSTGTSWT